MLSLLEGLLSPTLVAVATALVAAWIAQRHVSRRVAVVIWFGAAWAYLTSAPLPVNAMVWLMERNAGPICERVPDGTTLVVLMGGVQLDAASPRDYARLHEASLRRLLEARRLTERSSQVRVVVSGGRRTGPTTEGEIGASLMIDLGADPSEIVVESTSLTTAQSAGEVWNLLASTSAGHSITLVTSAIHMQRSRMLFERRGMTVRTCPADFIHIPSDSIRALLPQTGAVERARAVIHELGGTLWSLVSP